MPLKSLIPALLTAFSASAAMRPVAHWDVVPYQRLSGTFAAGVVAFYDSEFKVELFIDGKKVAEAVKPVYNERTRVVEHWFTVDAASMKDGPFSLGAKVVAADGSSYTLPNLPLYANAGGTLNTGKTVWLDQINGIDYSEGTKDRPVKTMKRAIYRAGDGGTVYLMRPGIYKAERVGGGNDRKYWTTVTPAPGLTRKDVKVKGGRTGCDKLRFKDVQLFCSRASTAIRSAGSTTASCPTAPGARRRSVIRSATGLPAMSPAEPPRKWARARAAVFCAITSSKTFPPRLFQAATASR